ncbi:hypothetical protein AQ505_06505 [Pedobacter sp. PACM 27299]|uniref:hypothetical protein n=1 Tax=Pedobacter sp. PACM 27299 TaxID=1727164 RepID=UPI000705F19F|nr:hypothetical protein [Pedobacter sp. PACM 27299]ALL05174.1 hypothetical protein AQ505_06505 [Pedobacter sp. PACM 27299]
MKNSQKSKKLVAYYFLFIIFLNSCSSRYVKLVSPDTKTEFGITLTTPSQGIFFVENEKVAASKNKIKIHTKTANSIYNYYGPATDKRFVGRTNARQLKFNVKDKTYLIDITKFKKRTAMVLFNGENKPIIRYNAKKYNAVVEDYFVAQYK